MLCSNLNRHNSNHIVKPSIAARSPSPSHLVHLHQCLRLVYHLNSWPRPLSVLSSFDLWRPAFTSDLKKSHPLTRWCHHRQIAEAEDHPSARTLNTMQHMTFHHCPVAHHGQRKLHEEQLGWGILAPRTTRVLDTTMRIIGAFFLHTRLDSHKRIRSIIPSCDIFQNHMNYRYLSVFFNVYGPSIGHFDVHTHVLHSSHSMSDFWWTVEPSRSNETDARTGFTKSQTEGHPNQDPSLGERTMAATEIINSFVTLAVTVEASPSKWHELFLLKPKMIWLIENVAAELEVPFFFFRAPKRLELCARHRAELGNCERCLGQQNFSEWRKGMGWEGVAFSFFTQMLANGTD